MNNRLWNCRNPYQGDYKHVLCVCSAGLLRSPTTALVLSQEPFNYNTRAAGVHDYALIPVDRVLLTWADEVVCMEASHGHIIEELMEHFDIEVPVTVLGIPDNFEYRDPDLMQLIVEKYNELSLHRI